MNYTAIGVGNYDLAANYFNSEVSAEEMLPFVSVNVFNNLGETRFAPYTSVMAGSYKIGISSVTDTSKGKNTLYASDWREALKTQIPQMKRQFDFIIMLSSLTTKQNKEIASIYPQINLIINADKNIKNLSPSLIGTTLITQTNTLGQYLGVLDIELASSPVWKRNYFILNNLQRKKYSLPKQIKKLKKQKGSAEKTSALNKLKKEQADLPLKIKMLKKELVSQKGSSFSVEFIPITRSLLKDPVIEGMIK